MPGKHLRAFAGAVQHVQLVVGDHAVKYVILLYIIQIFGSAERGAAPRLIALCVVNLYGVEALRIGIRKRLHQDVFHHAENGRRRPNP